MVNDLMTGKRSISILKRKNSSRKNSSMIIRLLLAVSLSATIVSAQTQVSSTSGRLTGELRLEVKDPSGKSIGASGNLDNLSNGVRRGFQTDAQGKYRFEDLPYGRYRLEVSKEGFARQSILIDVRFATPIERTVTMALGSLAFKIDVVATTPLPGVDLEPDEIPAPTQAATQDD